MRPFDYSADAPAIDAVAGELTAECRPLAGGTDLLPLLKSDVQSVSRLVDVKPLRDLPRGVEETADGIRIGALTTVAEIAASPLLRSRFALLAQAAETTATAQIRNRATLGGNLLQRPRCGYFRNPRTQCWLNGGDECFAVDGFNEQHAVFGESTCRAAHPSDLAGCLLALDATATLTGPRGTRRLALDELFAEPDGARRRETVVDDDELVVAVDVPAPADGAGTVYLKAMDRKVWAFALAGLALVLRKPGDRVEAASIVANGVAPIPWRLTGCEGRLLGTAGDPPAVAAAAGALDDEARPLSGNGYKLDLLRGLLERGVASLVR